MATMTAFFGKAIGNNKGSVQNFGIVGITIASEEVAKFVFFFCPCSYPSNQLYGTAFIWGPAFVLLIVGYLANRRTWRLVTGLCSRTQGIGRGGKRIFHFLFTFAQIGMKAMIAPATWFLLAMLKGDYYACAHWPNPYKNTNATRIHFGMEPSDKPLPLPCQYKEAKYFSIEKEGEWIARDLRAESHVIGWFFICLSLLLGVVGMFLLRCKSRFSYEQGNYIDRYRASEVDYFEDKLSEKAQEQAKSVVDHYFSKPRSKLEWDQIAVINDKVTKSKRGRPIYSPLHNFVNKELRRNDEKLSVPDVVGEAAVATHALFRKTAKQAVASSKKPASAPAAAPSAAPLAPVDNSTAILGAAAILASSSRSKPTRMVPAHVAPAAAAPAPKEEKKEEVAPAASSSADDVTKAAETSLIETAPAKSDDVSAEDQRHHQVEAEVATGGESPADADDDVVGDETPLLEE